MMKLVKATEAHLLEFYKNARVIDLEEVHAASGKPFVANLKYLRDHIDEVQTLVDADTGEVLGIGGVDNKGNEIGVIWLLLTYGVEKRKMEFLRFSKRYLKELHQDYDMLFNSVYTKNKLHIDWLNWLGAKWERTDKEFAMFVLKRKE